MEVVSDFAELGRMLQAQERLQLITDIATGTGSLKKGVGPKHTRKLELMAGFRRKGRGKQATSEDLSALGVEVVKVDG